MRAIIVKIFFVESRKISIIFEPWSKLTSYSRLTLLWRGEVSKQTEGDTSDLHLYGGNRLGKH